MKELSPLESLVFFEKNLPDFLLVDDEIKNLITSLKNSLQNEASTDFHANILQNGKEFIKHIISKSIKHLSDESRSPKNKAIKNIREYINTFTVFEEMLFGLDSRYRDHTLHSLWVYLFGHEFITSIGGYDCIEIAGQMSITYSKDGCPRFVLTPEPVKGTRTHLEAMWGMISILHDLGYPVEVISNRPNEIFGNILEPFAIDSNSIFQVDLGSRITLLHQSVCDLLATIYRPKSITDVETQDFFKMTEESGKQLTQIMRPPTTTKAEAIEMEFRIASVDKIHSAWSAILAFKNIAYLHESDYLGGGSRDYLKLLSKRDILYSIVHHTSEEPRDEAINRFQFILLLMDDIEEAIRYSRGGEERGIVSDFCEIKWEIGETKTIIELDYTQHNSEAKSKYKELENKYRTQIYRMGEASRYGYVIEINFIDKDYTEDIKLYLVKDQK